MVFADTSFLFSLYGNDANTAKAMEEARSLRVALTTTKLGAFELENAIRFATFRKAYSTEEGLTFLAAFEADLHAGRLLLRASPLDEVVEEARRLSATHTLSGGHRAYDVLLVAGALAGGAERFLSFDDNQRSLARNEGMEVGP